MIFSLGKCETNHYDGDNNISINSIGFSARLFKPNRNVLVRVQYLMALPRLLRLISAFKPDIIHSHFATSYGFLGVLSGFRPHILSVWGSDVYIFPKKSVLHKFLVQYNLNNADVILSTSYAMAEEIKKYTDKLVEITPFGINLESFKPFPVLPLFDKDCIVIGTIKTLEHLYGIEYLIEAFNVLKHKHPDLPLRLLLVGGGTKEAYLKSMIDRLGLNNDTIFTGKVAYKEVPAYHNMLSIYVALSLSESFGVSVIEASACEKPVVVSDVGGLPEVVDDGVTGFVVESMNVEKAVDALEKLVLDAELCTKMGKAGRAKVASIYNLDNNVDHMISIYRGTLLNN